MLPAGTVTFVLTDIEGSTRLWDAHPRSMEAALLRHDEIVGASMAAHGGALVKSRGEGDSLFAVFERASDGVAAAAAAQSALEAESWPDGIELRVRVGIHTGEAGEREGDYYGPAVNRAARLRAIGHGRQILVSQTTADLVRDALPAGCSLRDLGTYRLQDLSRPERVFQLVAQGAPDAFPPLRALDARPNNLPVQPTPIVGRQAEIAALTGLLSDPAVRLITITGPGGIGKTRLGLEVAAGSFEAFHDGVWFVPLAGVGDPATVLAAVAQAIEVGEGAGLHLADALVEHLRERQLLLLLDNFEHVIEAAAGVARLLAECSRLKVLVTSRETLRVAGEHEFPLPVLSLPRPPLPAPEALSQYEAVALFIERAKAVKPGFRISSDNAPAVAEICVRLDGLPLAIELAAARVKLFSASALLERLGRRLELLTGGARDAPERHRTLRGAIAWSYDLLSAEEQLVLDRLSVFVGGSTLEAAEAVAGGDGSIDVFGAVASLVDKSLLRLEEQTDGGSRFVMLNTVREFCLERLEARDELQALRAGHASWFSAFAERAHEARSGPEEAAWLHRLESDSDNIRAALEYYLARGDFAAMLGIAARAMFRFWSVRGYLSEGRAWLDRALGAASGVEDGVRAEAMKASGVLAMHLGDLEHADKMFNEALELYWRAGDEGSAAGSLNLLGVSKLWHGDLAGARRLFEESLRTRRSLDDAKGVSEALNNLGVVAQETGDYPAARLCYEEALELARHAGNASTVADTLSNLGVSALELGDRALAQANHEESLTIRRSLGDRKGIANSLGNLGLVAAARGDYSLAREFYTENLAIARETGDRLATASVLMILGDLCRYQGDAENACALIQESLDIGRAVNDKPQLWKGLLSMARLLREEGAVDEAREQADEALAIATETGSDPGRAAALSVIAAVALGDADLGGATRRAAEALELLDRIGIKEHRLETLLVLARAQRSAEDASASRATLQEALALAQELGEIRALAALLEEMAGLDCDEGSVHRAARLLAAAAQIRASAGCPVPKVDRARLDGQIAAVKDQMSPEAFEPTWAKGAALTSDEAIAEALQHSIEEVVKSVNPAIETIRYLAEFAELRDDDTGLHIVRMSAYAARLGKEAGMSPAECEAFEYAAQMHDIGKIGIPDGVLLKRGKLTDEEFAIMRTHPELGGARLAGSRSRMMQMAEAIAWAHHEKWDGSGYPKKLTREEIPLVGRIAAVADVFDALTSRRPYKEPWPADKALEEIIASAGKHFDPQLVELWVAIFDDILYLKERFAEREARAPAE